MKSIHNILNKLQSERDLDPISYLSDIFTFDIDRTVFSKLETLDAVVAKSNWPPYKSHSKIISLFGLVSSRGCAYEV